MVQVEITKDLVKKVAKNARLNLTDEELEKFTIQLDEVIINSFNKLDEIEANEKPSFQPIEQKNRLREDIVKPSLTQEEALRNVIISLRENGYIKGPKVI
ncbi:MAG: Asp-tRNA(Asn)/Glu-tRNA(Gln) amidotransferase subunit GatC [Candidatus ainarchaeum sp.]|nr:Asp-tRNA(Asn)/Glu-tRNA(Gln) amidotransferase subunit GatC [Candidatus ainarchaeum sp.]